jgi:hypothetical protein
MGALRYLMFAAVGVVVASVLFLALSFVVSANLDAMVGFVERRIVRATCSQYEISGTVRDVSGQPVPYAVIEASFLDERLTTRSNLDGTFRLLEAEAVCDRRVPRSVQVLVMADDFRPKRQAVPFETGSLEVTLAPREFRP